VTDARSIARVFEREPRLAWSFCGAARLLIFGSVGRVQQLLLKSSWRRLATADI